MIEAYKLPTITEQTEQGSICSFNSEYALPLKSLKCNITAVQSGSGTPSPNNKRPISGWSKAVVSACGVNLWDEDWEVGSYNENTGEKNDSVTTTIRSKNRIPIKGGASYYLSITSDIRILEYGIDGTYIRAISSPTSRIYSPSNEVGYINFRTVSAYGTTYNNDISINYPSTDTNYHAYNGITHTIQFGQDIYGGYFDSQGNLVITHADVDLGSLSWTAGTGWFYSSDLRGLVKNPTNNDSVNDSYCEIYTITTRNRLVNQLPDYSFAFNTGGTLQIVNDDYETAEDFTTGMNGKILVYELNEPITIPIDGLTIQTQEGQNNIFCDTGSTEVKFLEVN